MASQMNKAVWGLAGVVGVLAMGVGSAWAIDVKLSAEDAQKALEAGRAPMEKANTPEDVKKVLSLATKHCERIYELQKQALRDKWKKA